VTALDISPAMCRHLEGKLVSLPTLNVVVLVGDAAELPLADGSVDVVLSNYCLHHLRDADKRQALAEARRVLRLDGRIVIGDMMFHIGLGP
jgi:ubiquinone/menaquinone biosynthesis C-methylase UbiE